MVPLWSSIRKDATIPQQNLVMLSERIILNNPCELKRELIGGRDNESEENLIFQSLTELDSQESSSISHSTNNTNKTIRQSCCSESSSSESFCGIPLAISASPCLTNSVVEPVTCPIFSCAPYTKCVANRLGLSREERLGMIRQLVISFVFGNLASKPAMSQDPSYRTNERDSDIIEESPKRTTQNVAETNASPSCSVCQVQYLHGERISVNPNCSHIFHEECLLKHLVLFNKCPCCKETFLRSIL